MPNVIDATGKVVRDVQTPAAFAQEYGEKHHTIFRAVFRELANPRAGTHRRTSATKSPAAVASRGSRREPGARAKVRSARRSGATAASSSDRSRAATSPTSIRRNASSRFVAALADRFKNGAVTVLDPAGFALTKTADFATLLFGSAKAAKTGPATLIVFAESETPVQTQLARVGTQPANGRGHRTPARSTSRTSSLRAARLHDGRVRRDRAAQERAMDARDVIVSPRITEKSMADALGTQYTFDVHPQATKTQIRHAIEEIFRSTS